MDYRILAILLGIAGYITGLYIIGTWHAGTLIDNTIITVGMVLIASSAPSLGYFIRLNMRKDGYPTSREHMILSAVGFYIASLSLLLLYLGYSAWRPVMLVGSLIVALAPAFKW